MVVSGTHSLDMCMWLLEGRTPVEVYARSTTRTLGPIGTKDGTSGIFTMDDGVVFSMNINWALPTVWPGAVYGLEIGIVGTHGVIDVEDTHRDVILASEIGQPAGYTSRGFAPPAPRHVDFIGSYPPGDVSDGLLWGPMREETTTWFARVCRGIAHPHATAADGHANLLQHHGDGPLGPDRTTGSPAHQPRRAARRAASGRTQRAADQPRHHRHRMVRRHPRRHRLAQSARQRAASGRDRPGPARGDGAQTNPTTRDRRLAGHRREPRHRRRRRLGDAGGPALPDDQGGVGIGQARPAGEADRADTRPGRRAHRASPTRDG